MLILLKDVAKKAGIDTRVLYQTLSAMSIRAASREQFLTPIIDRLRVSVPDLRDQYTLSFDETEYTRYWEPKMRGLHAWQVRCVNKALDYLQKPKTGSGFTIVYIGDSSGDHATYIKSLNEPGRIGRVISINIDQVAIEKIKGKGGGCHTLSG